MDARERYYWDVTGHLVVRDVLSREELNAVNNVLDYVIGTGIVHQSEDMGAVANPGIRAGDVLFFMDGAQSHGTHPWQNDHDRRSILFKYASRTATRQGPSNAVCHPEIFWDRDIVDGMSMEERAVMYGPCSAPPSDEMFLVVEDDGAVRLENTRAQQAAD